MLVGPSAELGKVISILLNLSSRFTYPEELIQEGSYVPHIIR